ncbi:MAG: carbon-nitrogen hydrolase family protein [Planctomycetaceae bacterium]
MFKIAAAQVASVRGNLARNVQTHAAAIKVAAEHGVTVLVFPELSLIGYELDLAADLALTKTDERLSSLARLATVHGMTVIVGASLRTEGTLPALGAIVFSGDGPIHTYAKMHLGGVEPAYFAPGRQPLVVATGREKVGVAICADASNTSHPGSYAANGCTIYAVGVFMNSEWYSTDAPRLAACASRFRMLVVMANHAESEGTDISVGRSAVWSPDGELLAEAAGVENSLIIATRNRDAWLGTQIPL